VFNDTHLEQDITDLKQAGPNPHNVHFLGK